jgi:hypothetical protein
MAAQEGRGLGFWKSRQARFEDRRKWIRSAQLRGTGG